jgi:hypothetical protein
MTNQGVNFQLPSGGQFSTAVDILRSQVQQASCYLDWYDVELTFQKDIRFLHEGNDGKRQWDVVMGECLFCIDVTTCISA